MGHSRGRGKFVWFDLMTRDPQQVHPFYTAVAGWDTTAWDGPLPYTMWTVDNAPIGGVMPLPPGVSAPPHWMGYVAVGCVDTTVAQARALGANTLMAPTDIPTVGRFAVLADPQGAMIAVFATENQMPGHDGAPRIGEVSWHELITTDYAAAFKFYESLFGWQQLAEHDMGPMGVYLIFGRGGVQMGGMFNKPAATPNWLQYIRVDDVDRVAAVVTANGGTVINGPMEVPGGDRVAQCLDPQGAAFAVHSRKP